MTQKLISTGPGTIRRAERKEAFIVHLILGFQLVSDTYCCLILKNHTNKGAVFPLLMKMCHLCRDCMYAGPGGTGLDIGALFEKYTIDEIRDIEKKTRSLLCHCYTHGHF